MLSIIFYIVGGFFGFIFLLIILTILFGKKVEKKWDLEADFLNDKGREIGEFDLELKRYPEEQTDFELVVKFFLRHDALLPGRKIEVSLRDETVMTGAVEKQGVIRLSKEHLVAEITNPAEGDICTVLCDGQEICRAVLRPD